jgi:hypothetical protein
VNPDRTSSSVLVRWWQRRTLHARLALLVTGAVAAAVVSLAVVAWLAVAEIQQHQIQSQLTADAQAIAAQPDQWLAASAPLPDPNGATMIIGGRASSDRAGRSSIPPAR